MGNGQRAGTARFQSMVRPQTAGLMMNKTQQGLRPQTGITAVPLHPRSGFPGKNSLNRFGPAGSAAAWARAASAGIAPKGKLSRCMGHINRLKKKLVDERRLHRTMRTLLAHEIESKNSLEKTMRLCVDDVKGEITKKSSAMN